MVVAKVASPTTAGWVRAATSRAKKVGYIGNTPDGGAGQAIGRTATPTAMAAKTIAPTKETAMRWTLA